MNAPVDAALLEHATETIKVGSKSFAAAARLFDPATRRSVLMLYAWCRHCDDVVDGQELGFGVAPAASHDPHAELARLYEQTRRAYAGEAMTDPAFAAFQEVALGQGIAPRYAFDHLAGFGMDVDAVKYETIEDTLRYCYHVAGVVGLMMAQIMGAKDARVLDHACDLGLAFQLTNIARDIVDDARIGRCYLPAQWLREAGIPETEIALPRHRVALAKVAARLVDHAEPYYASAIDGIGALPLRSAWAIATARNVYRQIGIEVKARGPAAWDERVGTSKATKLLLLVKGGVEALLSRLRRARPRPAGLWQRPAVDVPYEPVPRHAAPATGVSGS
ncbi:MULTISPECIES: 15-cis-phytoene synthase CrtB [unclassified Massilia]|uniref:15-cis-phytoene synthase CrtB n=1 Tax=unclassified Massilia TaxID=2609279 RepID=UPI00178714C4|nr:MULTISPECIES: 15-cis-phytoene synthase CrtB [unclassified Massilia]MBD8528659.1 phytoene/squalene synthase family protein [Massilia sp. CFBP 13647]MBD8672263.1 phytoene/squalene synthase family protein [Massilia sp. CFBP 13721]